jgi:hypothetical protein
VDESEQLVKVLVRLEPDADREPEHSWAESEMLWALPVGDDVYELRNIPWETDSLHHRDLVRCRRDEDGSLLVVAVLERCGHATLRITFSEGISTHRRAETVHHLESLVGFSEKVSEQDWGFDINPTGDSGAARAFVAELEREGILVTSAVT